jgi:hypothetical protein
MERFIHSRTNKVVILINGKAAGMCVKTIGMTMVIYEYENENEKYDYPFIMEHREFYKQYTKVV